MREEREREELDKRVTRGREKRSERGEREESWMRERSCSNKVKCPSLRRFFFERITLNLTDGFLTRGQIYKTYFLQLKL